MHKLCEQCAQTAVANVNGRDLCSVCWDRAARGGPSGSNSVTPSDAGRVTIKSYTDDELRKG